MEVLFALGLGLVALLMLQQRESTPKAPPGGGGGGGSTSPNPDQGFWSKLKDKLFGSLDALKADYMADLRSRGWTGTSLSGNDADSVYAAYLAEIEKLAQTQADRDRERIRGEFESDLRGKGVFTPVTGSTPAAMYQSYLAGHLEYVRNHYIADLRRHGWAGSTLSGSSVDQVYQSYKAAYDQLVAQRRAADLDRIRAFYVGDLQRRGWSGTYIAGSSFQKGSNGYANYIREYNSLLGVKYGLVSPLPSASSPTPEPEPPPPQPADSLRPKFRIGDRVKTAGGRVGHISNWRWDDSVGWSYTLEDHPYTWYQESLLNAAPTAALAGGGGNVAV